MGNGTTDTARERVEQTMPPGNAAATEPAPAPAPAPTPAPTTAQAAPPAAPAQEAAGYELLSTGAGLIDRSERGRLALTGSQAAEFLNGQVSNDIEALRAGEGCYAAFLTHKGKMLGDLRVLAVGDRSDEPRSNARHGDGAQGDEARSDARHSDGAQRDEARSDAQAEAAPPAELLLETERVALQALFDTIRRFKIGYDVELHKRTLESCLLSVVGPVARDVVAMAIGDAREADAGEEADEGGEDPGDRAAGERGGGGASVLPEDVEHSHVGASIAGCDVRVIATAGPSGFDVLCDSGDRDAVEGALLAAGAERASEQAAEILRIEHGRPRYGLDLDDTVIPQEAGLNERAVSFVKGCYVGQETVARLFYKGKPNRHLRGLRLSAPVAAGAQLFLNGRAVGTLTSCAVSPALGPIGLSLLRREAEPGATLAIGQESDGEPSDGDGEPNSDSERNGSGERNGEADRESNGEGDRERSGRRRHDGPILATVVQLPFVR